MSTGPSFPFPSRPQGQDGSDGDEPTRRVGPLVPALIGVALLVGAFVLFAHFYSDVLWFDQLGYGQVFWTETITRVVLFAIGFLVMGFAVWLQLHLAWRNRPVYVPAERANDPLARFENQVQSARRLALILIPAVIGAFAAVTLTGGWQTVQLFLHRQPFGQTDPQFNMDVGFFVTTLPFLQLVIGFVSSVIVFSGIAGILAQYFFGGIRLQDKGGLTITRAAGWQLAISVALFLLVQGLNFWLGRYEAVLTQTGRVPGALYTDVHAVIPTRAILAIAAIVVALIFIIGAAMGRWRLPIIGTAMMLVVGVVAGMIYPAVIQQLQVKPSEKSMEQQYIQRNIDMTRAAYGLDQVEVEPYNAKLAPEKNALNKDAATTTNIRLLDPSIVSPAFAQKQQQRGYYQFPSTLAVDRYTIDGKTQDTVIAARELSQDPQTIGSSWVNQHVTYTHGYGVVAAYGNRVTSSGDPDFLLGNIPSQGVLGSDKTYEPRIYFGQNSPSYSVVGGPEGWAPREFDRPGAGSGTDDVRNTFSGSGGPNMGSFFNRLTYAVKFGSMDLMLSDAVNADSQILYDRDPQERVRKVAPYLTIDSSAYPAIVDGRVKWIIDAYTTSNNYPYSKSQTFGDAVRDSQTTNSAAMADQFANKVNYIRNSVKATVDAYDGSVDLYAWEPEEPLLKAWQGVFPSTVKPLSDISAQLMEHVRYPEDLFKVQRELLGQYHVTTANSFYDGNDAWQVPNDPTASGTAATSVKQPPYYMSMRLPGADSESFSLTSSFIPAQSGSSNQRNLMYGFLAADGDAGKAAGVKDEDFGKLTLLKLPTDPGVPGPGQAQQNFNTNQLVSTTLNQLGIQGGSAQVIKGNLLNLPVGGGILYVQPVYVKSTSETSYPSLRKVLVSFGNSVGFANTLSEALDQVFKGESGAQTGETGGTTTPEPGTPSPETTDQQKLTSALADVKKALDARAEAMKNGDLLAQAKAQTEMDAALLKAIEADDAIKAAEGKASDAAGAATDPAATPSASPEASTQP